jgi:hypothetical protein
VRGRLAAGLVGILGVVLKSVMKQSTDRNVDTFSLAYM